jgi:hypothetical protein
MSLGRECGQISTANLVATMLSHGVPRVIGSRNLWRPARPEMVTAGGEIVPRQI